MISKESLMMDRQQILAELEQLYQDSLKQNHLIGSIQIKKLQAQLLGLLNGKTKIAPSFYQYTDKELRTWLAELEQNASIVDDQI